MLIRETFKAVFREDILKDSITLTKWWSSGIKRCNQYDVFYHRLPNSQRELGKQICKQIMERCQKNRF